MPKKDDLLPEQRQYIRLTSVFPVQFRLLSLDGRHFLSEWLQGFTKDIGQGGLCLVANNLNPETACLIREKQVKISLDIDLPGFAHPVSVLARVAWSKEVKLIPPQQLIGLSYEYIDAKQNKKIMRYAVTKKIFVPALSTVIFFLLLALMANGLINMKLVRGNKALVEQLVKIVQESSVAKQKIKLIAKEREDLQVKIEAFTMRIRTVEEEKLEAQQKEKEFEESQPAKIEDLNNLVRQLTEEKNSLQEELIAVQKKENSVTEDLLRLDKRKALLEKENFDKLFNWLKVHQNPRTGLVMSFEGDRDIADWAFLYDQSLAAQAYINFADFQRAKKIFDFFAHKAQRQDGLFFNAYYASQAGPAEYIVQSGPNIWLGIAVLHYTQKANDEIYLYLAEQIAQKIIALQNQDKDGGVRGGPNQKWFATEHNLDAYAFFNMLYKIRPDPFYREAAEKALEWLIKHTYDKIDLPVARGKGDSTIATDTYAWSIAAIGPQKLEEIGMNPDRILEFAEQNCGVTVNFNRSDSSTVKIKGFDFAAQRHLSRGGVVSSEWTAQMVIAYKIMSDYYYKKEMVAKARAYTLKADEYLSSLAKMIITSPSASGQGENCLPYSTQDFVDTGHGWLTPKGRSTGSVSGTAYTLFAYYNYNPLEL